MTFVAGFENYTAASPADGIWKWLDYLVNTVGWTLIASSDATGAAVTHGSTGANGFDNSLAWMEVEDPGATYRMSFQRGTTNAAYYRSQIYYGGSSGGGATQVPTPTGSIAWIQQGGGTDASPTFDLCFNVATALMFHGCGDNAAYASTGVYRAWYAAHPASDARITGCFMVDAVIGHPSDTWPLVGYSRYITNATYWSFFPYLGNYGGGTNESAVNSSSDPNTAGRMMAPCGASGAPQAMQIAGVGGPGSSATNWGFKSGAGGENWTWAWDTSQTRMPFFIGTSKAVPPDTSTGYKGQLTMPKSPMNSLLSMGDRHNPATTDAWVCVHDFPTRSATGATGVMMPWPQNAVWNMS